MGCDIHCYAEVRLSGRWEPAFAPTLDKYFDPAQPISLDNKKYEWPRLISGRNYELFSILASVRNNCGFGPIDDPRDLPEDLSPHYRAFHEEGAEAESAAREALSIWPRGPFVVPPPQPLVFDMAYSMAATPMAVYSPVRAFPEDCDPTLVDAWFGDHSFSFFTLAELLAFDWEQQIAMLGCVDLSAYAEYRGRLRWQEQFDGHGANVNPNSWAGGIYGPTEITLERANQIVDEVFDAYKTSHEGREPRPQEMPELIFAHPQGRSFVKLAWPVQYHDAAGSEIQQLMIRLAGVAARLNLTHEDVRIVFGFDN